MKVLFILNVTFPFSWVVKSLGHQAQDSKKESGKNQRKEYLIQMDHPCKILFLPACLPPICLSPALPTFLMPIFPMPTFPMPTSSMSTSQPAHLPCPPPPCPPLAFSPSARPLVHQSVCPPPPATPPSLSLPLPPPPLLPIRRPIFKLECRCLQHITNADNQTEKRKPNFHFFFFFENRSSDLAGWLFIFLLCRGLPSLTNTFLKGILMKYF